MTDYSYLRSIATSVRQQLPGPYYVEFGAPTMAGSTWTLKQRGKPGIRMSVVEYQHGCDRAFFYEEFTPEVILELLEKAEIYDDLCDS